MDSTVVDLDLTGPLPGSLDVADAAWVEAVLWLHGRPLGRVDVPRLGRRVYRRGVARRAVRRFGDRILRESVRNALATAAFEALGAATLPGLPTVRTPVEPGQLTVMIGTGGPLSANLDRCLAALMASDMPPAEVIVVGGDRSVHGPTRWRAGNARPVSESPALRDAQDRWSSAAVPVRWLWESSRDPSAARRQALESTRSPLVAFVDESVRVDGHWVEAVCRAFQDHPNAAVVTGSILPDGASNEFGRIASATVERMARQDPFAGIARCRRPDASLPRTWFNVLPFGTGMAVAYRTDALLAMGGFDHVAAGRAAETARHFDLLLQTLESGRCAVREPAASCRVNGAPSLADAAAEARVTASACSSALVTAAARTPRRIIGIMLVAQWFVRTALGDVVRGRGAARSIAWARLCGHLAGMAGAGLGLVRPRSPRPRPARGASPTMASSDGPFREGRIVPIDLALAADDDPRACDAGELLAKASSVPVANVLATWRGHVLGVVEIVNAHTPVTLEQVRCAVIDRHWDTLLVRFLGHAPGEPHEVDGSSLSDRAARAAESAARVMGQFLETGEHADADGGTSHPAPFDRDISIVIPSRDRPDDLRECLQSVLAQETERRVEVIVVDNHPESGVTPPVVAEFPGVRLLSERRQGSAYARNRGLLACRGSIVVCVDDDVVVSAGWLERILAPFADQAIDVVTGNVVPFRLDTEAERLSETFTSLSAGGEAFRVDGEWFHASPAAIQAWDFGVSANMAARSRVFGDPAVGLFAESLGPGTPVGAGEDPYFVYRVVKAGYGLRYCPDAWVWHRHRRTLRGLHRQVYNYAKSAVGYYLITGFRHGDIRSRMSLFGGLQRHDCRRLIAALRGRIDVPVWMVLTEIAGHVAGGFAYLLSERRRRSLERDPSSQATPPALPDRSAEPARDRGEPWAIGDGPAKAPGGIAGG